MAKGGDKIQETPQQRAQVEFAVKQLADYKKRWLPVQQRLATTIQRSGEAGSAARRSASGRSNVDTQINFKKAQGAVDKMLASAGAAPGSAKANLATTGVNADTATSRGFGGVVADQKVDDAYLAGLSAIAATGRGERQSVADSLSQQASTSARQAASDAQASLDKHAAQAGLIGQFAGVGLQSAMNRGGASPRNSFTGRNDFS